MYLNDFESEYDYALLNPEDAEDGWTLKLHRQVMRRAAELLEEQFGIPHQTTLVNSADYFRWLAENGRKNTTQ